MSLKSGIINHNFEINFILQAVINVRRNSFFVLEGFHDGDNSWLGFLWSQRFCDLHKTKSLFITMT